MSPLLGVSKPYGYLDCTPIMTAEMRMPTLPTVIVFVSHDNLKINPCPAHLGSLHVVIHGVLRTVF